MIEFDTHRITINTPEDYRASGLTDAYSSEFTQEQPELAKKLPVYADLVAEYVGNALEAGEEQTRVITDRLLQRVEGVPVYQFNTERDETSLGGYFHPEERTVLIFAEETTSPKEITQRFQHEAIHAMMTSGTHHPTYLPADAKNAMNGVQTNHLDVKRGERTNSGHWLNEALVEHVRRKVFPVSEVEIGAPYNFEIALLRTLFTLEPRLEQTILSSAFIEPNKGKVWGEIEDIMGPLWIEHVAEQFDQLYRHPGALEHNPLEVIIHLSPSAEIERTMSDELKKYRKLFATS